MGKGLSWSWIGKTAGGLALGTGVVLAVLPSLLSTKLGLETTTSILSRTLPGQVEVRELSLGWTQPVRLAGLRMYDSPAKGGRLLVDLSRLDTTESLWKIATGHQVNVVVSQPIVDCTFDDGGEELRVMRYLKDAKLVKEPQPRRRAASGNASPAATKPAWTASLTEPSTAIDFTADVRLLNADVFVADGKLAVADDVRQILGSWLHGTAVLGSTQLLSSSEELGLDASWIAEQRPPAVCTGGAWGGSAQPGMARLDGEHVAVQAAGWQCPDKTFVLRQPAEAEMQFHPALAKYGLSRTVPLLKDVVAVQGQSKLHVSFFPDGGRVPFQSADVQVEPMHLVLGRGSLLEQLLGALKLQGLAPKQGIQVWTSAVQCTLSDAGDVCTKRMDMRIGTTAKAVQLALWGSAGQGNGDLDMHVAIPQPTLAAMGLRNLPEDFALTFRMQGSKENPALDWREVAQKLATLTVWSNSQTGRTDTSLPDAAAKLATADEAGSDESRPAAWQQLLDKGRQVVSERVRDSAFVQKGMQALMEESAQVPAPGALPWLEQKQ